MARMTWTLYFVYYNLFALINFFLDKVAKERPPDPIQYVADYLHGMKPEKDSPSPKKSNISPPRSPNKITSQKIEPDTTNEDKNTHQNGILEENGHHSRLDDFKVSTPVLYTVGL